MAKRAMKGRKPLTGPVSLMMSVSFKSKDIGRHTSKPDIDNIVKAVCDSLNGIVYLDDCQISDLSVVKVKGPEDFVYLSVWPFEESPVDDSRIV